MKHIDDLLPRDVMAYTRLGDGTTILDPGDVALVLSKNDGLELFIPHSEEISERGEALVNIFKVMTAFTKREELGVPMFPPTEFIAALDVIGWDPDAVAHLGDTPGNIFHTMFEWRKRGTQPKEKHEEVLALREVCSYIKGATRTFQRIKWPREELGTS